MSIRNSEADLTLRNSRIDSLQSVQVRARSARSHRAIDGSAVQMVLGDGAEACATGGTRAESRSSARVPDEWRRIAESPSLETRENHRFTELRQGISGDLKGKAAIPRASALARSRCTAGDAHQWARGLEQHERTPSWPVTAVRHVRARTTGCQEHAAIRESVRGNQFGT
jgi:hypothetical protein